MPLHFFERFTLLRSSCCNFDCGGEKKPHKPVQRHSFKVRLYVGLRQKDWGWGERLEEGGMERAGTEILHDNLLGSQQQHRPRVVPLAAARLVLGRQSTLWALSGDLHISASWVRAGLCQSSAPSVLGVFPFTLLKDLSLKRMHKQSL